MTDSQTLLAEYARNGSEPAFRELVASYLGLVYSTALRLVGGDAHMAEDVAQIVFANLARTARTLSKDAMLGGWLHRDTCFVAGKIMRGERRRQSRERQAAEMNALNNTPDAALAEIAPVLDEAINQLGELDRAAILLRFFEQRDLYSVGHAMGSSENGAQKRVSRALEKLHILLKNRGVTLSAGALAATLASQAVAAAPAGLVASIAGEALATAAAGGGTALTLFKIITMTSLQKTLIVATIVAAAGTGIYEAHQASTLRAQVQRFEQAQPPPAGQIDQLTRQRDDAIRQLAALREENERSNQNNAELLKLRAEVARLRSDSQELAQLKAGNSTDVTESSAKSWVNRVNLLKQRLEQNPSAKIPELKYVNEQDWLNASKGELNTEADYRRALSTLRSAGESKVASMLKKALAGYVQASNGQFPTDLGQLRPYFDSPVDDAVLQRWEIAPAATIKSLGLGGDVVITQKAPVDEVFDTRFGIGPVGSGTTDFLSREIAGAMDPVWEAYRTAHNGQWPNDTSQLLPYATTPEQQAALQKLLLRSSGSK